MKRPMEKKDNKSSEPASATTETDYTEFFKEAAKHIQETDYLTKRGISEETQNKFNIGYCKEWKHPTIPNMTPSERIIIPTSKHSYIARATNEDKEHKVMKVGKTHLFNSEVLSKEGNEPIFIVEGEIDALSIVEAGGQAIGLGGTSNINLLINELEKNREAIRKRPYIICLDNDDAGKKAFTKLQNEMKIKGFSFMDKGEELIGTYKDPNEALVADKDRFKEKVAAAKTQGAEMLEEEKENYIQEYKEKLADVFTSFYKKKKTIETGLTELDKLLDGGLHAGLYVLAAASGAGKTTFALQIADHIAKNKQGVLFFSGEMTIYEIMAKSLSRLSKETSKGNDRNALTMRTILNIASCNNSYYQQRLKELITENYYGIAEHMRIYDGLQEIEDIKEKIEEHKRITDNNPVIFIDYLQIIKNKDGSPREKRLQVDEIVSQLRIIAAKYETPIFVISSLNRTAYGREKTGKETEPSDEKDIYMTDLKESGGIEYGADVIITLQAEKETDDNSGDVDGKRPMKLRVIKNRTGRRHNKKEDVSLDFHCRFNYFESQQETTNKQNDKKKMKFIGDEVVK